MFSENEMKKKIIRQTYIICSMLIAFFSSIIIWYINIGDEWSAGYNGSTTLLCVGFLYCFIYYAFMRLYNAQKIGLYRLTELVYSQGLSFIISDAILFVESVFWFHGFEKLNIFVFIYVFIAQIFIVVFIVFILNRLFAKYDSPRKTLIIYGDEEVKDFLVQINKKKLRYEVIGCISDKVEFKDIQDKVDEAQSIYLVDVNQKLKQEFVIYCNSTDKFLYITQDIPDLLMRGYDVSHTFDIPMIRTKKTEVKWYYPIVKRGFDIFASSIALILLSPILLIVAILIKCYDGGPVFYTQIRLTKGHKEFKIYKFRSMIVNAEKDGARLSSQNDDRITPIGKFIRMTRIDELPQLINILKGDMSIIGPRPERPEIEKEYLEELPEFALRLQVPAGLSGYAQVFGKYNTTPKNKLKLDLLYINERSVLLDLKLILYTVKIIFVPESSEGVEEVKLFTNESVSEGDNSWNQTSFQ